MKKTLVIANILFASAEVFGLPKDISTPTPNEVCMLDKLNLARKEIREVINRDQETREKFFTGTPYGLNLKKINLNDIKKSNSDFFRRFALVVDSGLINHESIVKLLFLGKRQIRSTTDQIENIVISDTGVSDLAEPCKQEFPLHYAYEKRHADVVKSLINLGMNVDQLDGSVEGGKTLLDKAIRKGDKAMVEYLVSHDANVNREHLGSYPLFQAFYSTNLDMMKCLVENGADLNLRDFRGFTILQAVQEELRKMDLYLSQLDKGDENNFDEDLKYEMKERSLAEIRSLCQRYKSLAEDIIRYLKAHGAIE